MLLYHVIQAEISLLLRILLTAFVLILPPRTALGTKPNAQINWEEPLKAGFMTTPSRNFQTCPLSYIRLPAGVARPIAQIQYNFKAESGSDNLERTKRQLEVKSAMRHSWNGYKSHAWLRDELRPISGGHRDALGGWSATLVDSLDTLLIMGMDEEFNEALEALDGINFTQTNSTEINVFETTIRYLGGLLGANDLTDGKYPVLLRKATEVADLLYEAFETPSRMPQTRWRWRSSKVGSTMRANEDTFLAELGSLTLEFTRLSQLTNDPRYFDVTQRITDNLEYALDQTKLPGLWPVTVDAHGLQFSDSSFTAGAMADSTYEYLLKEYILLGGLADQYRDLYNATMEAIKQHLLFRVTVKNNRDILFAGNVRVSESGKSIFHYQTEHLKCFLGGMVAIGAKVFNRSEELAISKKLVDGCVWAYDEMPTGVMPEILYLSGCREPGPCEPGDEKWYKDVIGWPREHDMPEHVREAVRQVIQKHGLQPPVAEITDPRYYLRPEAFESLFVLYRITGDETLRDAAWRMFQSIEKLARTKYGYAALGDVRDGKAAKLDLMESFWLAETLKYCYLIFSEPELVSLDKYIFNTEGHPLKRPPT